MVLAVYHFAGVFVRHLVLVVGGGEQGEAGLVHQVLQLGHRINMETFADKRQGAHIVLVHVHQA